MAKVNINTIADTATINQVKMVIIIDKGKKIKSKRNQV